VQRPLATVIVGGLLSALLLTLLVMPAMHFTAEAWRLRRRRARRVQAGLTYFEEREEEVF
jgi:cobalt-zinc-cadmium resistance protein CzcA